MADDDKTQTGGTPAPRKRSTGAAKPKTSSGTAGKTAAPRKTAATRKTPAKGATAQGGTTKSAAAKSAAAGTAAKSAAPAKGPTDTSAAAPGPGGGKSDDKTVVQSAADRLDAASEAVDRAATDAANWAKETGNRAGETISQASERTAKAAERASEALSEAASAVSDAAESFAGVSDAASGTRAGKAETRLTHIAYLLFALSPIAGVTSIAGLMLAYLRRRENGVSGTLLESHYNWLVWTFWYGVAAGIVSGILVFIYVGFFLLALTAIWMIWRLTKGWLYLYDGKAISNPTAAL